MEQQTDARVVVAVVADDLIWASRLRAAIERAGAQPVSARSADRIEAAFAVIDLTARTYDPVAAVRAAASGGAQVLAVAEHDDLALRRAALAAGATRVYSYNKLFRDGAEVIGRWLAGGS